MNVQSKNVLKDSRITKNFLFRFSNLSKVCIFKQSEIYFSEKMELLVTKVDISIRKRNQKKKRVKKTRIMLWLRDLSQKRSNYLGPFFGTV